MIRIKQASISEIPSRSYCNPHDNCGFLPLITAPMYGIIDDNNINSFFHNGVQLCHPRRKSGTPIIFHELGFTSLSINDVNFIIENKEPIPRNAKICIDVANGNMKILHEAINALKKYEPTVCIMSGNIATVKAFEALSESTNIDYIRVGIGGGNNCSTTINVGVGQDCLYELVKECYDWKEYQYNDKRGYRNGEIPPKIVADGISGYIRKNKYHRNGYRAINELLYAGADLVMLGSIFVKCFNSAAPKNSDKSGIYVTFSGMSTKNAQKQYSGQASKASEGLTKIYECEYSLKEWLKGSDKNPDNFGGFVNHLQSAMSYTGCETLDQFRKV